MKFLTKYEIEKLAHTILVPGDINSLISFIEQIPKQQWITGDFSRAKFEHGRRIGTGHCYYGFVNHALPPLSKLPHRYDSCPMSMINDGSIPNMKCYPRRVRKILKKVKNIDHPKDRVLTALKYMRDHP